MTEAFQALPIDRTDEDLQPGVTSTGFNPEFVSLNSQSQIFGLSQH
jgi:hypothetical protein